MQVKLHFLSRKINSKKFKKYINDDLKLSSVDLRVAQVLRKNS